jgi:hypothetical protein
MSPGRRLSVHVHTWLQAFRASVPIGCAVYQYITKDLNFKSAMSCNYLIFNIAPDYPRSDSYACPHGRRPATVGSVHPRAIARQTTKRHGALCRAVACEQSEHAKSCYALACAYGFLTAYCLGYTWLKRELRCHWF